MENRRRKSLFLKIALFILFLAGVAGTEVIYLKYQQYYSCHFFPGTTVNGMEAGEKTVEEVQEMLEESIDPYSLTLSFRDGESETLPGESIGYVYIPDNQVLDLMAAQDAGKWFLHLSEERNCTVQLSTGFSLEKLTEEIYSLPELSPDREIAPTDAFLEWNGTEFVIVPENDGYMIDEDMVFEAAYRAASEKEEHLDVTALDGVYTAAAVRSDDEKLNRQVKQLESLLPKCSITYELPADDLVLDGSVMEGWLAQDEEGNYSMDEKTWNEGLSAWFSEFADSVDTLGKERTFVSEHAGTVTLAGTADYGWVMDRKEEKAWLEEAVKGSGAIARKPVYTQEEFASMDDHSGIGGSFIEADLTAQHLWVYQDGEEVFDTDLVSGLMTEYSHTPDGVWILDYKETDTTLLGDINEDGEYGYAEYVNYWMRVNDDGIGLHDATWRDTFGGDIYINNGSHGCLNLPLEAAGKIYEYIDAWTPVVIYYAEPYELHEESADS